ncbi:MAG TPA: PIN domain-containing protein [Thermoanaerobaculia bacterium]|nr:PIN domain-containing protein [Thermoanaerobaculia bacterium]
MKVYLDSGVFIDLLATRGHAAYLRTTKRRGRDPERLRADAENCLTAIQRRHSAATSTITCWEVEEAMYRELVRRSPEAGVTARGVLVAAARLLVTQTLGIIDYFQIQLVDLTRLIVTAQSANLELQNRGIRAADALHITTAIAEGAELLITTDANLIRLDNVFENSAGASLHCVDTDQALSLLA